MGATLAILAVSLVGVVVGRSSRRLRQARGGLLVMGLSAAAALTLAFPGHAQDGGPQVAADGKDGKVLYLVEMVRTGKAVDDTDRLLRVTLGRDGNLVSKVVLTAKARFFGEPGKARIVEGRYVVTQFGGIVDAEAGRIVLDQGYPGQLIGIEKGQVFFRINDLSSPFAPGARVAPERAEQLGVFAFNLKTGARSRPAAKHWYLEGLKSPDQSKTVTEGAPGVLWLNSLDGSHKKLGEGNRVTMGKHMRNFEVQVPTLWLDNERILTQQGNGNLVILDTQGKVERVCEIPGLPAVLDAPRLSLDPKGRILYACGRSEYVIDVKRRSASLLEEYALGHGFETPVETETRGLRMIFFEGKAIGNGLFAPAEVRTAPEVIAKRDLGADGSRRWVSVLWTQLGFQWRGLDLDYGGIIGWAE